jgi:hypothetical protein
MTSRASRRAREAERLAAAAWLPTGEDFRPPPRVAPGVLAFIHEVAGMLVIPSVIAERPGSGDVARWLDTLPRRRGVVFVEVMSDRLAEMLARRGFRRGHMRFGPHTATVMVRGLDA